MTDQIGPSGRASMVPRRRFGAALMFAALVVAACGAATPRPSGSSGPGPSPTSGVGEIDHPTGATTVILRVDEGGGFVAPSFFVTQAPLFSLYGDGTAIFRDPSASPPPAIGQVIRGVPFQAVRLSEDEIQGLLAFALGPGGLAIARAQYELPVADAPTTTFTIVAGGLTRTVSVNGLGLGGDAGADAPILAALANLRARLAGFGATIGGETPWAPDRYRGILMEEVFDATGAMPWPWTTCTPNDFAQGKDVNAPPFPIRTMTPAEVAKLGMDQLDGGAQGFVLVSPFPAGVLYTFSLRPLLPDETR